MEDLAGDVFAVLAGDDFGDLLDFEDLDDFDDPDGDDSEEVAD